MTMAARLIPQFIMIRCDCGRALRARWEQVGEEIRCWDCQASRTVVAPRSPGRLVGRMIRSGVAFLTGEGMTKALEGASLVTLTLLVPGAGLALAGLLLVAGAAVYADMIRSGEAEGREFAVDFGRLRRGATPARLAACLGLVAGTVGPLWSLGLGPGRSPHLGPVGPVVLGLCWTVFPLALVASGRPEVEGEDGSASPPAGRLGAFLPLARFPLLTLGTLLIVPAGLLACEALLLGTFSLIGGLPTLTLDYMPRQPGYAERARSMFFGGPLQTDLSFGQIVTTYWGGLKRGYSFVGSIPPSFSFATRWGIDPRAIYWTRESYAALRILATFLTVLALTLSFAIQARCLNVLIHSRRRFLA